MMKVCRAWAISDEVICQFQENMNSQTWGLDTIFDAGTSEKSNKCWAISLFG